METEQLFSFIFVGGLQYYYTTPIFKKIFQLTEIYHDLMINGKWLTVDSI